jgi:hypothetical protein
MKSTVAAVAALTLALAATTAFAGLIISQQDVFTIRGHERKFDYTVMIQGHKQKVITSGEEVVTDLDAGKMYIMAPKVKRFSEVNFPPAQILLKESVWKGSTIGLKKTDGTHKVAGYACQDYTGSTMFIRSDVNVTKCIASDAPGAREFVEFQKAMAAKLKGTPMAPTGEVPDGIPVSATFTSELHHVTLPPNTAPEEAAKIKQIWAMHKPITSSETVSKIEVKNLPADTFVVPAGYTALAAAMRPKPGTAPVKPGSAPAAPGSSTKPGAPAAP